MQGQKKQSLLLLFTSLIMLVSLVAGSWSIAYGAPASSVEEQNIVIPTFSILSVQPDVSVTIRTQNFRANDTYNVLMNVMGTRGVGGTLVGTVNSGAGGSFDATFNIPANLRGLRQIAIRLESPTTGYFSYNWFYNNPGGIPGTGPTITPGGPTLTPTATRPPFQVPTFTITAVTQDVSVSVRTANFPANDTFNVLMNYMGTRGVNGINVGSFNSGAGGTLEGTFNIPAQLRGQQQIAIRFESPTSGYFSFNWFYNTTTGGIPGTGPTVTPGGPTLTPTATREPFRIPTFTITAVTRDVSVSVQTANFPANDTFNVLMNVMGTRGEGGINVGSFNTGAGGTLTGTFNIPAQLRGLDRIAIRFESPTSGYFSFNWFYNNTTTGGIPGTGPTVTPGGPTLTPAPTSTPFVTPTITIVSVVRDTSVTIQTANYPPNDNFTVLMNFMGTRGVNGINVGTFNSGTGGTQTATFNIPPELRGQHQIAIRLQSPTSGLFSFNWFYNNTTN